MPFKRKSVYIMTFLLIILSFFSQAQLPCVADCTGPSDSCYCAGGCDYDFYECSIPKDPDNPDPCDVSAIDGGWCEGANYYVPEFPLIPGFLTFLSSLGIPYWLFRKRK